MRSLRGALGVYEMRPERIVEFRWIDEMRASATVEFGPSNCLDVLLGRRLELREYRGSGRTWFRWPSGNSASRSLERWLADVYAAQKSATISAEQWRNWREKLGMVE